LEDADGQGSGGFHTVDYNGNITTIENLEGTKMKLKKIIAGHLLALVLVFPQVVTAADFNLGMKTFLSNLHPDVAAIKVNCAVVNASAGSTGRGGFVTGVGEGSTTEKVPASGEINKTILVKFNANPGSNPAGATNFNCNLVLIDKNGVAASPTPATNVLCENTVNDWKCGKQGAALNNRIAGTLSGPSTSSSRGNSKKGGNSNSKVNPRTRSGIPLEFSDR
jgi:hypothetical protein